MMWRLRIRNLKFYIFFAWFLCICNVSAFAEQNKIAPVYALSTAQNSQGMTQKDFTQELLSVFENNIVNTYRDKTMQSYKDQGHDPQGWDINISTSSNYATIGKRKLMIIKMNVDNEIRMVSIAGIVGNEFRRVNCMRNSNHDIPIWSGICGSKIKEILGVYVNQLNELSANFNLSAFSLYENCKSVGDASKFRICKNIIIGAINSLEWPLQAQSEIIWPDGQTSKTNTICPTDTSIYDDETLVEFFMRYWNKKSPIYLSKNPYSSQEAVVEALANQFPECAKSSELSMGPE